MDQEFGVSGLLSSLLGDVISGAVGELGAFPVTWILGAISGSMGSDSKKILDELEQIEETLQEIQSEIEQLSAEIKAAVQQLTLVDDWETLIDEISPSVSEIEAYFETFSMLRSNDVVSAKLLQTNVLSNIPTGLQTLHDCIIDNGQMNPKEPLGLLSIWAQACAASATPAGWNNGDVGPGSPLDSNYRLLEDYFTYLLGLQIRGLTLLVNALLATGEANLAQDACQMFITRIGEQAQTFVAGVEMLTVSYCADLSLIGLVSGPHWTVDPVRRASLYVDAMTRNQTFHVRIWTGYTPAGPGTGGGPEASDAPLAGQSLALGTLSSDAGTSVVKFSVTDPRGTAWSWSLIRSSWTNPPLGVYWLQVSPDDARLGMWLLPDLQQVSALWLDPNSPQQPCTSGLLPVIFNDFTPPGLCSVVLTGVTTLMLNGLDKSVGIVENQFNFGSGDFTLEAWIYPTSASEQVIVSNKAKYGAKANSDTPGQSGTALKLNGDGTLQFYVDNGYAYYLVNTAPVSLSLNNWHHVAAVRENYQLSVYVDGQPVEVTASQSGDPSSMDLSSVGPLLIGGTNGQDNSSEFDVIDPVTLFTGAIDDVRVWSVARTQQQISSGMYTRQVPQPGLLAAWCFDTGQAVDRSGHQGQFELNRQAAYTSSGFSSTRFPPALLPMWALAFDGAGRGYLQIPATGSLVSYDALIASVRVRLDGIPQAEMMLIACGGFSVSLVPVSAAPSYPALQVTLLGPNSTSCSAQGGQIRPGHWCSVRATWSSNGCLELYVDELLVARSENTSKSLTTLDPWGDLYVGIAADGYSAPLAGALSRLSLSGASSDLYLGFWPLDEGSGTVAADVSGNANDGSLQGKGLDYVEISWLPAPGLGLSEVPSLGRVVAYQAPDGTNRLVLAWNLDLSPEFLILPDQETAGPVALANSQFTLAMVYVANDRSRDLCVTWADQPSGPWSFSKLENQQAGACMAAAMVPELGLCIAYEANDGSHDLCITYSSDYQEWSFLRLSGQQVGGALAIAPWFDGTREWLVIAYRANDGSGDLYVTRSPSTVGFPTWTTTRVEGPQIGACMAATTSSNFGAFVIAFQTADGSNDLRLVHSSDLQSWTSVRVSDQEIGRSMAAVPSSAGLAIAYQAADGSNQLYLTQTSDFSSWTLSHYPNAVIGPSIAGFSAADDVASASSP